MIKYLSIQNHVDLSLPFDYIDSGFFFAVTTDRSGLEHIAHLTVSQNTNILLYIVYSFDICPVLWTTCVQYNSYRTAHTGKSQPASSNQGRSSHVNDDTRYEYPISENAEGLLRRPDKIKQIL